MRYYKFIFLFALQVVLYSSSTSQLSFNKNAFDKLKILNAEDVNSENLELSPFFYNQYIGFVYANPKSEKDKEINQHYFDLAFTVRNREGKFTNRANFNKQINSKQHEGPSAFDETTAELYFTRTYYNEDEINKRDTIVRKIYRANSKDDFKNPTELSFCNDRFSHCHPTLFDNNRKMIYASNDEESIGGMDLFIAEKTGNIWKKIKRLQGPNTTSNEVFPFVYADSILVFASDREGGSGGYDMYMTVLNSDYDMEPIALPYPINSSFDDIGLIINATEGLFSSNRPGGKGMDDIYTFAITEPLWQYETIRKEVSFSLLDKLTFKPISGAEISITSLSKSDLIDQLTDMQVLTLDNNQDVLFRLNALKNGNGTVLSSNENGAFSLNVSKNTTYIIKIKHPEYDELIQLINKFPDEDKINIVVNPRPNNEPKSPANSNGIYIPTSIGEKVVFDNVYYDLNSDQIRAGAASELDALAEVMLAKSSMIVELSAHTDAQGDDNYNRDLSIRRAKSALEYLIKKGISGQRVRIIGFGESQIRNHCINGIACNDDEHAYNRRTEVKVISQ